MRSATGVQNRFSGHVYTYRTAAAAAAELQEGKFCSAFVYRSKWLPLARSVVLRNRVARLGCELL